MAIFNRYKRLEPDPFGQIPDDDSESQPPEIASNFTTSFRDDEDKPVFDPPSPPPATEGAPVTPAPPKPSMAADSMDKAKGINPVAEAPIPPVGMAGAPQPPKSQAQQAFDDLNALKQPERPQPNKWQKLAAVGLGGLAGFNNADPRRRPMDMAGAEQAVLNGPKYGRDMQQYQQKRADLGDKLKMAESLEKMKGDEESRLGNASAREQNALNTATKNGIVILSAGEKAPDGYVRTINPLGDNPKYAGSVAYHDPNFGKFQVTPEQQALNPAVKAGQWLPLSEMSGFIKGGFDMNKPAKADFVNVSKSTADAMHIVGTPNEDGTMSVPTTALNSFNGRDGKSPPLTKETAAALNQQWSQALKKPVDAFREGMQEKEASLTETALNAAAGRGQGSMRIQIEQQRADTAAARDPNTEKEYVNVHNSLTKTFDTADKQLQNIDQAKAEINAGAMGQAFGTVKSLVALAGGAGSGVRITQAELNSIVNARGLGGSFDGWLNSIAGRGKLSTQQVHDLNTVLDEVKRKGEEKRAALSSTLDKLAAAKNTQEIRAVEKGYRDSLFTPQQQHSQGGHGIPDLGSTFNGGKVLKVEKIN